MYRVEPRPKGIVAILKQLQFQIFYMKGCFTNVYITVIYAFHSYLHFQAQMTAAASCSSSNAPWYTFIRIAIIFLPVQYSIAI